MILKLQEGGFVPPFVSYTPVIVQDKRTLDSVEEESKDSTTKSATGDITMKDTLKMIQDMIKGLPSDQAVAINQIMPLFQAPLSKWAPQSSQDLATKYLYALNTLSNLEFNKNQYDAALDIAKSKDSLNEAAITSTGYVYCVNVKDKNDFKLLRPEDIAKNRNYRPITNQDLLYMRANNKDLAFNNEILGAVNGSTSIKEITDYIQKCITGLGSSSQESNSYVSVESGKLLKGLKDFQDAVQQSGNYNSTVQDLYNGKLITKDQAEQAQKALAYIYQSLPENMRSLLKIRTNTGTDKEAFNLLSLLVNSKTSTEQAFELKLEEAPDKDKSNKNQNDLSSISLDPVSLMLKGYGQKNSFTIQTAEGASNGIQIPTVQMPITKQGHSIGISSLQDVSTSDFAGALDFSNAFMGDAQILQAGMQNIAIDGTAIYAAYLPLDLAYYNQTGKKRPDIALLGRYKQAQDEIKSKGITNPQQINAVYRNHQLPIMYSPNGDVLTNYIKFGILNGTALDTAFEDNAEFAKYLNETSDQNTINGTLNVLNKDRGKDNKVEYDTKSWWDSVSPVFNDYTHVYKGTIFMPINDDYFTSAIAAGASPTIKQAEVIEARQQATARTKGYVNPGPLK